MAAAASTTTKLLKFHHYNQIPQFKPYCLKPISPSRSTNSSFSLSSSSSTPFNHVTITHAAINLAENEDTDSEKFDEYLAEDGVVYQRTLRLVECAMFAAVSALAFLLSNSLAIEKYFACFFSLPIVMSTMRWGVVAGRKTMVATVVLLFVLSGPVKAVTYLLLHGLSGFAMGALWRSKANWGASILSCSIVRALGALGNVVILSYLIGENILALITINAHAGVTFLLSTLGFVAVPSMNFIYFIFGVLLMLNCGFYIFLLHLLYAVFFTRLGMKASLSLPEWLDAVI